MLEWLLDASPWMPRGSCGDWDGLDTYYIVGSILIWFAYAIVPIGLTIVWHKKRKSIQWPGMVLGFAIFIAACGSTHVLDALTFIWPAYRFLTLVIWITAFASLYVAIKFPFVLSEILTWKTPDEYRSTVEELQKSLQREKELKTEAEDRFLRVRAELHVVRNEFNSFVWKAKAVDRAAEIGDHLTAVGQHLNAARNELLKPLGG